MMQPLKPHSPRSTLVSSALLPPAHVAPIRLYELMMPVKTPFSTPYLNALR